MQQTSCKKEATMRNILIIVLLISSHVFGQDKSAAKISGYMYSDYFYNISRDTSIASLSNAANSGAQDLNGFQFRRIYLTFDGDISPIFSSRFRIEGTTGAPIVKDAYIKWKNIFNGSDMIIGMQPTPAFDVSESVWGYRSLEKTILDLRGIVSSRDVAVSLRGKLDEKGMMGYWVMLGNNSGTGAETDKYKRIYGHLSLKPTEKIVITAYGDYKMKSNVNNPASTATPKATLANNTITAALFVGYTEKNQYSLGAEGFYQSQANGNIVTGPPVSINDKNAVGLSLFGSYTVSENFNVVGRYDYFDPNMDSKAKGDARNYIIAGVDYKADARFSIIPNVQFESYENLPTGTGSRSVDASITGRITFFYTFL